MKSIAILSLIFLLLVSSSATLLAADAWQASWDRTVAAAKQEGRLNFYVGRYGSEPLLNEFRKEFPEINFFGLLVGPRGNSLKKMERDSGAKISIRGKGSVKEGKARPDQYAEDAEEDLHCLVIADSEDKVAACVKMINRVIETVSLKTTLVSAFTHSFYRRLPLLKAKTITSAISFESSRL